MKTFKLIDTWLSILIYVTMLTYCLVLPSLEHVILAYCSIGSWQVISMAIHEWNNSFVTRKSIRRIYHWIALACLISLPMGSFWILIFTAPFMAAFYIYLCYKEVYIKMRRPLALLK